MGVYSLTWGLGFGLGPVMGGFLNDNLAPEAIWYSGLGMGLVAVLGFALLARVLRAQETEPAPTSPQS